MLQKLQIKSIFPGFHAFSCLNLCITYSVLPDASVVLLSQSKCICISMHEQCCEYNNLQQTYTIKAPTNTHKHNEFNLYTQ